MTSPKRLRHEIYMLRFQMIGALAQAILTFVAIACMFLGWPATASSAVLDPPKCLPTLYGQTIGNANVAYLAEEKAFYGTLYCRYQDATGTWFISGSAPYCLMDEAPKCDWLTFIRNYIGSKMTTDSEAQARSYWSASFTAAAGPGCAGTGGKNYVVCRKAFDAMCLNFPGGVPLGSNRPPICLQPAPPPIDLPPPPAEVWKVKPSGTAKTRVVYTVTPTMTKGPLTSPLITVPIGTECNQAVRYDEKLSATSAITYMGVPGGIAVCEKQ